MLLTAGADQSVLDPRGRTPLSAACALAGDEGFYKIAHGWSEERILGEYAWLRDMIDALIHAGANLNARQGKFCSPWHGGASRVAYLHLVDKHLPRSLK
jgi:hypothetical protein